MSCDLKNTFICTLKCVFHRPFPFSSYLLSPHGQTHVICNAIQATNPMTQFSEGLVKNFLVNQKKKNDHIKMKQTQEYFMDL